MDCLYFIITDYLDKLSIFYCIDREFDKYLSDILER